MSESVLTGNNVAARIPRGTTRLPIGSTAFTTAINFVGDTFQIADIEHYRLEVNASVAGVMSDVPFAFEIFNETLGTIVQSTQHVAPGDGSYREICTNLYFAVTNPAHFWSLRIRTLSTLVGEPLNAINLQSPIYRAEITVFGGFASGITGGGAVNRVAKFTAPNVIGNSNITDDGTTVTVGSDAVVTGNLGVQGTVMAVDVDHVLIEDPYLYQGANYVTAAARTGGTVVNYLPTATADTVAAGGFTAGVGGVSNPTMATTGAATFALADLIQISGATNPANNGLFEVLSHAANVLTIRGIGLTATVEAFTQNQFATSAAVAGAIRKVGVSVIRAGTDGIWETGRGNVTPIAFTDVGTGTVSGTVNRVAKFTAATTVGNSNITDDGSLITINSDAVVTGNLEVQGTVIVIDTEHVLIEDSYLYQNNGYTTAAARTGGTVVNYLPTATADTVAAGGFTAGVGGVSNPTVATTGAATFALADLIQISGATNPANNGLFEVLSHAANVLTIRGIGLTATVEAFTQNQFATSAAVAGAITKVGVSVIRAGTDGIWETGRGNVTPIAFADVGSIGGSGTVNYIAKFTAATTLGDSSVTDTGALVSCSVPLTVPGAGTRSERFGAGTTAAGDDTVVVGNGSHAPANNCVVIGSTVANNTFSGVDQVLIGYSVGTALTSGASNTICGADAGDLLTTGGSNCLYGYNAETFAIDTAQSVGIGYNSVTASNSVVIGYSATTNTVGVTVIGSNAVAAGATQTVIGNSAKGGTGADGVIIGYAAANSGAFTGGNCVIIGNSAASNITSGNLNTILGSDSGDLLTTGSQNVLVGFNCETSANSTSNAVAVGSVIVVASTSVAIGDTVTASAVNSVVIGYSADGGTSAATNSVIIGDNAANGSFTGVRNVCIGSSVASSLTSSDKNTIVGADAGDSITAGLGENCLFGQNAEVLGMLGSRAVCVGSETGAALQAIAVGYSAYAGVGNYNVVVGSASGNSTFTQGEVVIVGYNSGINLGAGGYGLGHVLIGANVGSSLTDGQYGILIGHGANNSVTFSQFVGIGYNALVAEYNVAIGSGSSATFSSNIVLGRDSAATNNFQFVAGSATMNIADVYFGSGVSDASPVSYIIHGTGSSGAAGGGNITIAGGVSASGVGGSFKIQVASGASLADRLIVSPIGTGGAVYTSASSYTLINSSYSYQNNSYTTVAAKTGGTVINYLPTATADTVAAGGFTAGVAGASNPTVMTTGAATFTLADLIQISGASNPSNNGLFEVLSHAANVLTIRGVGLTAAVEAFTQNQFVTNTTVAGTITKVGVSVLRAGTDGVWETGKGNVTPISFTDIGTGSIGGSGTVNYIAKFTAATTLGDSSVTDTGALVSCSVPLTVPGAGTRSERFGSGTTAAGDDTVVVGNGSHAPANNCVVIGSTVANNTFSGVDQVLIGYSVGTALTNGSTNTICGALSGNTLTEGIGNCFFGRNVQALDPIQVNGIGIGVDVSVADYCIAIGASAIACGSSISIGTGTGSSDPLQVSNICIGNSSGTSFTTAQYNDIIGSFAGTTIVTGSYNCLHGDFADVTGSGTTSAVAIGWSTRVSDLAIAIGYSTTAAAQNSIAIGAYAGNPASVGDKLIIIGYSAATSLTSGSGTICGSYAGTMLITGTSNCLYGDSANTKATNTQHSVAIGSSALAGTNSVAVGSGANAPGLNTVTIGSFSVNNSFTGQYQVLIGSSVGSGLTSGGYNTICGADAGDTLTTGGSNCLYGYNAETALVATNQSVGIGYGTVVGTDSVAVGYNAKAPAIDCVIIGSSTANAAFTGTEQVVIGYGSALSLTIGNRNTVCGAVSASILSTGGSNSLYGYGTQTTAITTSQSVVVGASSTVATDSVVVGYGANAPAINCVVIGSTAANATFTGTTQVLIGYSVASALTSGDLNTICGATAGDTLTTGIGNSLYGYDAETIAASTGGGVAVGSYSLTHSYSVAIGSAAWASHTPSIILGASAVSQAANQFVAGSSSYPMNNIFFGKGVQDAAPTSYTINGTGSTGAAAGGNLVIAGGVSASGVGGSVKIQTAIGASLADRQVVSPDGNFTFTQAINTTGSPTFALWTGAAHTTLAAGAEAIDIDFALNRLVTFSSGAITTQRAFVVRAPTYNVGANAITTAATFAITDAPGIGGGGGSSITNALAFWVQAGKSQFADHVTLLSDSAAVRFGAGTDMSIYYNGSNGIINTSLIAASDLTITCGSQKTFVLTNTVWMDANVGGATLRGGSTNPPITQIVDNVGTNTGIYALGFDLNDEANGCIEIPHDYAEGTNLVFHVHWFGNAAPAGGTDNVKWQVTYSVCRGGVTTPPATTPAGTEVAYTTQYAHVRTDLATITGTNFKIGDQVHFNIKRIAASADDYAGLTLLDTVGFHYQCDTMGSRQTTVK